MKNQKTARRIFLALILIVVVLILLSTVFATVPTGHTGVVTTLGKVEDYIYDEGLHFKLPWQKVTNMDNRTQRAIVTTEASSSDIQQVDVLCSVNYSVDRETSQKLFGNVGASYYETVMEPRIYNDIKTVFANYSAENLIACRSELADKIAELLMPEMKAYGIAVSSVSIENLDFSDAFTEAVEAKQVAEQDKLRAATVQAQKTLEAEAEAKRQVIAAEADAEITRIQAEVAQFAGEKEAAKNQKLSENMNELLIAYNFIEKWNGKLPTIYSGSSEGMLPILNINPSDLPELSEEMNDAE
ncbi:MAG: prohibitin family protein [Lachnospiraceae bacterium]|nr:prohibitin family protein [Lachnospiraceae bacterium]